MLAIFADGDQGLNPDCDHCDLIDMLESQKKVNRLEGQTEGQQANLLL